MDIGIGIPNTVPGVAGRELIDWAVAAERHAGAALLGGVGVLLAGQRGGDLARRDRVDGDAVPRELERGVLHQSA